MLSISKTLAAVIVASSLLAPVQAGMYPSDGPVINLDAKGFKKVMASEVSTCISDGSCTYSVLARKCMSLDNIWKGRY